MKKPMWNSEAVKAYETGQGVELVTTPHPHYRPLPKELESQEPVAWMDADGNVSDNNDHKCFPIPLYTHPPQRTWVGLSMEQFEHFTSYVRADVLIEIEEALMENNT